MASNKLPVGSFVWVHRNDLQPILDRLKALGYRIIGPQIRDRAVILDELDSADRLPRGRLDEQDGGYYRLEEDESGGFFDHVVGPHSLKNFLFPPQETVLEGVWSDGKWQFNAAGLQPSPLAVVGLRACDLQALRILDRVFLQDRFVDPAYEARRAGLFVIAVNCRRAAATCFCHSMKTGPAVKGGFDLALTEVEDRFVIEVGSDVGGSVVTASNWSPCTIDEIHQAREVPETLRKEMRKRQGQAGDTADGAGPRQRFLDTTDLHDLLLESLEHDHWEDVAERCLSCGNCTAVCPTCFCSNVVDASDLTGREVRRERIWASCFTAEHSYMNTGSVRKSIAARYRQWLTHKLATWIDQFGTSGCVGCGRCITWCPVGIDLTQEAAAIRGEQA